MKIRFCFSPRLVSLLACTPSRPLAAASRPLRHRPGCAIREQWTASRGTTGTSLNYFDSADGEWHQDWVGGDGTVLHLRGRLLGSDMVLSGESKTANATALNRITWTPLRDGKVKQSWSTSGDKGQTWQISFVGIYEKQP